MTGRRRDSRGDGTAEAEGGGGPAGDLGVVAGDAVRLAEIAACQEAEAPDIGTGLVNRLAEGVQGKGGREPA